MHILVFDTTYHALRAEQVAHARALDHLGLPGQQRRLLPQHRLRGLDAGLQARQLGVEAGGLAEGDLAQQHGGAGDPQRREDDGEGGEGSPAQRCSPTR